METETIFRVQDDEGRGPWRPGFSHKWVISRPDHDNLPPWYVEFGPVHEQLLYGEQWGTGCRTIKQLRRWFTKKEYKALLGFGYKAVMMEANRILAESDIQLVFGRAKPLNQDFKTVKLY